MCTIAHTPRLPEHCVEYVRVIQWPKDKPFGDVSIDGDDPEHIKWIHERAMERAKEYGIVGVTYRLTQGVVKRIVPAVASTNASVAALVAQEAFKLATNCSLPLNNYLNFQTGCGVSTSVVELERRSDCPVCSRSTLKLAVAEDAKLQEIWDRLVSPEEFNLRSPGIYLGPKPLYVPTVPSLEEQTRMNLKKSLQELGVTCGTMLIVADATRPNPMELTISHLTAPSGAAMDTNPGP